MDELAQARDSQDGQPIGDNNESTARSRQVADSSQNIIGNGADEVAENHGKTNSKIGDMYKRERNETVTNKGNNNYKKIVIQKIKGASMNHPIDFHQNYLPYLSII